MTTDNSFQKDAGGEGCSSCLIVDGVLFPDDSFEWRQGMQLRPTGKWGGDQWEELLSLP